MCQILKYQSGLGLLQIGPQLEGYTNPTRARLTVDCFGKEGRYVVVDLPGCEVLNNVDPEHQAQESLPPACDGGASSYKSARRWLSIYEMQVFGMGVGWEQDPRRTLLLQRAIFY